MGACCALESITDSENVREHRRDSVSPSVEAPSFPASFGAHNSPPSPALATAPSSGSSMSRAKGSNQAYPTMDDDVPPNPLLTKKSSHLSNIHPVPVLMVPPATSSQQGSSLSSRSPQHPSSIIFRLPTKKGGGGGSLKALREQQPSQTMASVQQSNWSMTTEHTGGESISNGLWGSRRDSDPLPPAAFLARNPLHSPSQRPHPWVPMEAQSDFQLPEWSTSAPLAAEDEGGVTTPVRAQLAQDSTSSTARSTSARRAKQTPAPSIAASLPRTHVVSFSHSVNVHYDFPSASDVLEALTGMRRCSSSGEPRGLGLDTLSLEGELAGPSINNNNDECVDDEDDSDSDRLAGCFAELPDEGDNTAHDVVTDQTSVSVMLFPSRMGMHSELGSSTVSARGQVVTVALLRESSHRTQLARPKI